MNYKNKMFLLFLALIVFGLIILEYSFPFPATYTIKNLELLAVKNAYLFMLRVLTMVYFIVLTILKNNYMWYTTYYSYKLKSLLLDLCFFIVALVLLNIVFPALIGLNDVSFFSPYAGLF